MGLRDVVGAAGLSFYAQVALVIFFVTFIGLMVYIFARRNRDKFERARHMPLDDETPQTPRGVHEPAAPGSQSEQAAGRQSSTALPPEGAGSD